MTPKFRRSLVQVLVVRVDTGVVIYEAMTPQCGRSVVQVLVVRVDIGVMTYEALGCHSFIDHHFHFNSDNLHWPPYLYPL